MRWRWALGIAAVAAGAGIGALVTSSHVLLPFTLLVAHQLFGAMLETLAHAYRGLGRTDIESSLSLTHRGAIALGALTVLAVHPSLLWLSVALAVPSLLALLASHVIVRRFTARMTFQGPTVQKPATDAAPGVTLSPRQFRAEVAPLGFAVLLSALYFRCDVYFIQRLHDVEMVGVYNAAFRIVDALRLFPAAALAVAYPTLCAATDLKPVRRLSIGLAGAALAVTLALIVAARPLLALVYGDAYAAAGGALQVLSLCMPFFYVNYALTHQLIAWEGQRAYLRIAATALFANLIANSALIPRDGMIGAAAATLITEVVVLAGCVRALRTR
jgi:O-antigen/teichoic acid export membrane protein